MSARPTTRSAASRRAFLVLVAVLALLLSACDFGGLLSSASPTPWSLDESGLADRLGRGLANGAASIDVASLHIPDTYQDKVFAVFQGVVATSPDTYLCRGSLEYEKISVDGGASWTIKTVRPSYQPQKVVDEADKWLAGMDLSSKAPVERVRLLHDRIVRGTSYDEAAAAAGAASDPAFSASGVFFGGKAVCQGYAESLNILLNRAGVPSVYVSGTAKGVAHAWVLVQLDGKWFNIDPTFDDPIPDRPGQTSYSYFLMTDAEIAADHVRDIPTLKCADAKYDWMHRMEDVVTLADGRFAFSDGTADGTVTTCAADGTGAAKVPFKVFGTKHATTRGYYLCLGGDGALFLSNFLDGAKIYSMASGASLLVPFTTSAYPDGILPARNLRIAGSELRFDLTDDQGNFVRAGAVAIP